MWVRTSSPSLWYRSKKSKAEAILRVLSASMSIFGTHLAQKLWQPCPTVIISQRTVREICGNSHETSEIVKRRLSQIFCRHFIQDHHSLKMAEHFALYREYFFSQLWTFYTTVLQLLHSLTFWL
jgi:hypothetical protein